MGRRDNEQKVEQTEASRKYLLKKYICFQDSGKRLVESEQFIKLVTNIGKKEGWLNKRKRIKHPE